MVSIFPTRANRNCLLLSSDQTDRLAAQREIAQWAAERDLTLPARPRSLSLIEGNTVVAEFVVLEREGGPEPRPPLLRAPGGLRLVEGGRAA